MCASVDVYVSSDVGVYVCLSWPHHYKADTFVFGLITIKHTRNSRTAQLNNSQTTCLFTIKYAYYDNLKHIF